jgi:outer membrane protein OmpA-like peptidoglycan-associated protein
VQYFLNKNNNMNTRALLMLLAFLGWSWFTWSWLQDNKQQCCLSNLPPEPTPSANNTTVAANDLPLSFAWGNNDPVPGNGYGAYIKDKTGGLAAGDSLLIRTWYYEGEPNGEQLAIERAEKIRMMLKDSVKGGIKTLVEKRTLIDSAYKNQQFVAADFSILRNTNAPPPMVEETDVKVIVRFATNSNAKQLEPEIDAALTRLAEKLKANPAMKAVVSGHTDNVGNDAKNMALSQSRAEFVKTKLVEKGVNAANLTVDAKGETQPVATNDNEGGRKLNRRVEINIQ